MSLRGTADQNNLSIISKGYGLVIWKSSLRWKPESIAVATTWKYWIPAFAGMTWKYIFWFFLLKKWCYELYIIHGCARRGVSGALFPKSALCGAEFPLKGFYSEKLQVILIGRHATDGREPRQIRKEAAISDAVCVADWSRSISWLMFFWKRFDRGCATILKMSCL